MEQRIVQQESSLPFHSLPVAALRGRGIWASLVGGTTMLAGVAAALRLLHTTPPAAILGTGGYVCVPLFVAAWLRRIPTLIYLPDVVPGQAIRLLARLATRIACNVPASRPYLPPDTHKPYPLVVTGYPVQAELFTTDQAACRAAFGLQAGTDTLPTLLVYGGSLGARSINRAVLAVLPDLLELAQIIHICGREGDEGWLREAASGLEPRLQARYRLYPYLERSHTGPAPHTQPTMIQAFGAADLALCRSGASTLAELPAAGLPAVLVPYPYVHQEDNADYLVHHNAAIKVLDSALPGVDQPHDGPLMAQLRRLLTQPHERHRMADSSRALARPDAARHLADVLLHLAQGGTSNVRT